MARPIKRLKVFFWATLQNQLFWIITLIMAFALGSGYLIMIFESPPAQEGFKSPADGIWWAVVTMTTVGYGDRFPVTDAGRIVGVVLMFSSIILVSFFTATVSSIFVARKIQEGKGLKPIKFESHVLLCGWNPHAPRVLETLNQAESLMQVVLINQMTAEAMESFLQAYADLEVRFDRGDFTKEEVLERANIRYAATAILLPDRSDPSSVGSPDQRTILAAHVIRSINPEMKVFAHVLDEENLMDLKRAEVDGVVVSDAYTGELMADYVSSPGTPQVLDRLMDDRTLPNIRRVAVPERFVGRPSSELSDYFKQEQNWLLMGYVAETPGFGLDDAISGGNLEILGLIRRKVQEAGIKTRSKGRVDVNINPPSDYIIRGGDYAIVISNE